MGWSLDSVVFLSVFLSVHLSVLSLYLAMTRVTMPCLAFTEACGQLPSSTSEVPWSLVSSPNHLTP